MKVKTLIKKLSKFDGNKEVYFMSYKDRDDDIDAFDVQEVDQTVLTMNDYEDTSFEAVVLLHEIKKTRSLGK